MITTPRTDAVTFYNPISGTHVVSAELAKDLETALQKIRALRVKRMGGDHWGKGEEGLDPDDVFDIIDEVLKH